MKRTGIRFSIIIAAAFSLSTLAMPGNAEAGAENAQIYRQHVETHHSRGRERIDGAEAVLLTTREGVFVSISTRELIPGNAYTLWLVVINKPEACEHSPCRPPDLLAGSARTKSDIGYAGGLVANADGTGHFTAYQPLGELSQAWYGNGLQNPQGAEIHLVINDHGPLLADMVSTMLGSYRGGCTDESLPPPFPATAKANGIPGPNKCALFQVVVFMQ